MPTPASFRSPLAFPPTIRTSKPKRESPFHPTHSLHCIQSPPLLFPTQSAACPAQCSPLKTKDLKISPPPFNGADKNKGSFAHGLMLAAGSSHSFNRSIRTSFHYFIRSPHQLQHPTCKCFVPHTHTYPHPRQQLFELFYLPIVSPIKPIPDHCRFNHPALPFSSCY